MDWDDIGLKVGIEIHQRLRSHKLFCSCSSAGSGEENERFERRLRATAGEMGEVDPAAMYEFTRGRVFEYVPYQRTTCLVEMDEEPPHQLNEWALEAALQMAKALDCNIPDELQVMRKTVIDGSNTTGFQRTVVVGMDGGLTTPFGVVGIENIALEEESAQILDEEGDRAVYGLDRLGIPLIEIGTSPDANTPEQAKEMAETIGGLLRSTGKVQRGIGTIRQDVNISIEGGARVEVKGFQEIEKLEELVEREAERQLELLKIGEELLDKGTGTEGPIEVTQTFTKTDSDILREAVATGGRVYAAVLEGFQEFMNREISGTRTVGKELSDYAVAHGVGGIIHSEEQLGGYNLESEFYELRENLDASQDDVLLIVAGDKETARQACEAVVERVKKLTEGVPEETRFPNPDATTSYARPLPGGDRLYPETDVPPIQVTEEMMEEIGEPESLGAKRRRLIEEGVPEELAENLVDSENLPVFEEAAEEEIDVKRAAEVLTSTMTRLRREGVDVERIDSEDLVELLRDLDRIPAEAVPDILKQLAEGESYGDIEIDTLTREELEEIVEDVIERNREVIEQEGEAAFKKLMGQVMEEVRGRIEGSVVADTLRERLSEEE